MFPLDRYKTIKPLIRTAWTEIDVAALRHNLQCVRRLAPRSRVMAMLKADAYGHGLMLCADGLHDLVDGLAVARLDEASRLRQVYPQVPLLLTASSLDRDALQWCAARNVAIVVHEGRVLHELLAMETPPAVWLKLNSGMNRLGFSPDAFRSACLALHRRGARPTLMTHFACADDPADPATAAQIACFDAQVSELSPAAQSLANSAGVMAFPQAHRDWVRPGLMLYGANPLLEGAAPELRPVMQLKARVLSVSPLKAGEAVGYGQAWRASQDTCIAMIGIGYGDGYPRGVDQQARVQIRGKLCPLAGRVSMDLLAVDVGRDSGIDVGDEALLWGHGLPVDELARAAGTISYELLCRVQQRVPRLPVNA